MSGATSRREVRGTVYLLHFDPPYQHAGHYLGFAEDLDHRIAAQLAGRGARLVRVALRAGVSIRLVRTWPGTRRLERQLKKRKESPRLCPVCRAAARTRRARRDARAASVRPGPALLLDPSRAGTAAPLLEDAARYWAHVHGPNIRVDWARTLAMRLWAAAGRGAGEPLTDADRRRLVHLLRDAAHAHSTLLRHLGRDSDGSAHVQAGLTARSLALAIEEAYSDRTHSTATPLGRGTRHQERER